MPHTLLATGMTGALGPPILAELVRSRTVEQIAIVVRDDRKSRMNARTRFEQLIKAVAHLVGEDELHATDLRLIHGHLTERGLEIERSADWRQIQASDCVLHAAAETRFLLEDGQQRATNVDALAGLLEQFRAWPCLEHLVLLSTTCVVGQQAGRISETLNNSSPSFVNGYEGTKWRAEQLAAGCELPVTIMRLSTCIGSEQSGAVFRPGGIHFAMQWMYRGLMPLIPGSAAAAVDFISTECAAKLAARAITMPHGQGARVLHVAAGDRAPPLADLVDAVVNECKQRSSAWRRGQIAAPLLVTQSTFAKFRHTVMTSGDVLFQQVLNAVDAFLPALLFPKVYVTDEAERLWGGPLPVADWRTLLSAVLRHPHAFAWSSHRSEVLCDV